MHAEGPLPDYFEDLVAYVAGLNTAAAAAAASATAAGAAAMPRGSLTCGQSSPSLLISPSSSPENPLRERSLQFSVSAGVDDNGRTQVYLIQTINASDPNTQLSVWICANAGGTSPNTTEIVAPLVDTVDNGPFPSLDLVGAVNVQVAAYTARDGVCLGVSPPQTVHYDLRYTTLTHSLDVTPQDHNWVRFTASPVDAILGAQTQSWTFSLFNPTETTWTPDTLYKQNHSGEYNYQFGAPGVYFFGLVYSSNGFDLHATRAAPSVYDGLFAQPAPLVLRDGKPSFQPIAVVVPFANGSVPSIPSVPKFVGRVVQLSAVPEDVTLCMPHRQLTILAGPPGAGVVFLPLCRPTTHVSATQHLGIKLPAGVTVLPAPTGSVGLVVQNISRLSDGTWVIAGEASTPTLSTVIAVVFKAEASLVGTTVDAQLATYAGAGPPSSTSLAWQTVELIVVAWPTISRIPQHLITAITDAPVSKLANLFVLDNGASLLDVYSRLGMSVFPTGGANQIDPRTGPGAPATKHGRFYFPVNRTGPEWPVGLKYGIEYGTFSSGFNGPGFYCLTHAPKGGGGVGCPVNASALPSGLSPQQRASELTQWTNAVAFLNTTGYSDMAYSGFLLNESFVNLELVTSIIRPDAVFSDAEKFPPYDVFVSTIGHSANANDHHRPGETDCTLAARIAAEFLQEWVAATGDAVLYFYGDTPEGGHGAHGPWLAGALAQYGEQIVPQFGLYNAQASYPIDVFAKWIRMNKVAHETRGLHGMVPWVTTGFDGPTTAPQTLVQAVHLFAGGCTGFNIFCTAADGDCDSWGNMLAFTRAVQLVEPYEELVAFGSVAFSAVLTNGSNSNIFAVSAVEFHGQYLVALSAKDSAAPMHVVVNVSSSVSRGAPNWISLSRFDCPRLYAYTSPMTCRPLVSACTTCSAERPRRYQLPIWLSSTCMNSEPRASP